MGDQLWTRWSPQLVTALGRIGGRAVGFLANQPQSLAGTLDIAASQKGARFVRFCDWFNLPLVTLVDTPGFLPGKDLELRGMIRHGAELAFAYAEATVPRVCVILRKAFGGAHIVMDSKGLGNDLCFAWPGAEIAVMEAEGAVQILNRRARPEVQEALRDEYAERFLTPWKAAERGFVDAVIDPEDTRMVVVDALDALQTSREVLPGRKHRAHRGDHVHGSTRSRQSGLQRELRQSSRFGQLETLIHRRGLTSGFHRRSGFRCQVGWVAEDQNRDQSCEYGQPPCPWAQVVIGEDRDLEGEDRGSPEALATLSRRQCQCQ